MYRFSIPFLILLFGLLLPLGGPAYGQHVLRSIQDDPSSAIANERLPESDRSRGSTSPANFPGGGELLPSLWGDGRREPPLFSPLAARSQALNAELSNYELLQIDGETAAQLLAFAPNLLELSLPVGEALELVLHRVDLTAEGFSVRESNGGRVLGEEAIGLHYRGHLRDRPEVPVALSLSEEIGLRALIALPEANMVLGPVTDPLLGPEAYVLYADEELAEQQSFSCHTADNEVVYDPDQLRIDPQSGAGRSNACVRVYLEVDYDIYLNKGGTAGASAYVSAAFNEVAALYEAIGVNLSVSEILVWNTSSPYTANSSSGRLTTFQATRTSFNGDLAQLLSYGASGGIAVLNGLCHPYNGAKMSFSSIGTGFASVPTYSWTIMVMAHELGHQLGSQHTHACVWNGNGTAIDGCPSFTEGNCPVPGSPAGGGNIMSYCHLDQVGINFNVGFGQQPAAVIQNAVNAAACLGTGCGGGNPPPPPPPPPSGEDCTANTVYFRLAPDNFGPETSWKILDNDGEVVASGGPYGKMLAGSLVLDTICLTDGCYDFVMFDSYGDGICCEYGNGSVRLSTTDGNLIFSDNEFEDELVEDFCLPGGGNPPSGEDCLDIDFVTYPPISYGQNQDNGQVSVQQQGNQIYLRNNAWKAIELPYTLTPETVLEFDFRSTLQGEVHGIGFDDNLSISAQYTFRLYGTQNWGNSTFDDYAGNGQWQHFVIPVGEFLLGDALYMHFVADHDNGLRNGNSYFRNVRLYEGNPCDSRPGPSTEGNDFGQLLPAAGDLRLWPNPTVGPLRVERSSTQARAGATYEVMTADGRLIRRGQVPTEATDWTIDLADQAPGTYWLRYRDATGERSERFQLIPN